MNNKIMMENEWTDKEKGKERSGTPTERVMKTNNEVKNEK